MLDIIALWTDQVAWNSHCMGVFVTCLRGLRYHVTKRQAALETLSLTLEDVELPSEDVELPLEMVERSLENVNPPMDMVNPPLENVEHPEEQESQHCVIL